MTPYASLILILTGYEGEHYWDIRWYEASNQMSLWWDDRPVFIYDKIPDK